MKNPFNKSVKINIWLILLFFATISLSSQTTISKNAKSKTLIYTDYSITGYIYKKEFVNGQDITILSLKSKDTLIYGNYFVNKNFGYINGVWKSNSINGITYTNGLFKVSNSNNVIGLTVKPKEADSLKIITEDVFYFKGFRNNHPALLKKLPNNNYSLVINYDNNKQRQETNAVIKIELTVDKSLVEKYGFYSIDDFMYYTTDVKQTFSNGDVFIGVIENLSVDENNTIKYNRKEGKFIYSTSTLMEEEIIAQGNGNYIYRCKYSESGNNLFEKLELNINKSHIEKYGFWANAKYIENIEDVKYTYRNGNVFIGKVENTVDSITNSINSKLSKGILKYPTGEEFQGNISGQWYCGIPISGKMIFSDGSIKNGNWLETYNLNHREYDNVLEISSPTKKLALAKELFNEKQFTNAINKARYALSTENYLTAKEWFVKALYIKPDESEYINSRIENIDKLYKEQIRKKELIEKYGDIYGNKILEGELVLGMSQEMVNEHWPKKHFNISYINRNYDKIIIWEFDKQKMQEEIIKKGKESGQEKGALGVILMLNLSEQLGGLDVPKMLVFKNNKLTEFYR